MIKIPYDDSRLPRAKAAHASAVCAYVKSKKEAYQKSLFDSISGLIPLELTFEKHLASDDWSWLERFLLADVGTLKQWTTSPEKLQFDEFLRLYKNRFCAGSEKYVDNESKYNAYSFIRNTGITVCPYCDEEYLHVLTDEEGRQIRTLEIDHFHPKGLYPALAMCFFNLVPSCQACNGLKREKALGANPFEEDIEEKTWLYPDLPIGVNVEKLSPEDCEIRFHPSGEMTRNISVLGLEQRYLRHRALAHHYLTVKQNWNESKVEEFVRAGFATSVEQAYRIIYMEPLMDDGQRLLLTKLKHDMTGR